VTTQDAMTLKLLELRHLISVKEAVVAEAQYQAARGGLLCDWNRIFTDCDLDIVKKLEEIKKAEPVKRKIDTPAEVDYTHCRIVNIRKGSRATGRDKYIYADLFDENDRLVISATLDYISEQLTERLPTPD